MYVKTFKCITELANHNLNIDRATVQYTALTQTQQVGGIKRRYYGH